MSKRALTKYLSGLKKKELELQLIDLYSRFPIVKEYYDFIFNPKEDKLLQDAKIKVSAEYFPQKRKRAKARRSVAHKLIKHFITLGVDPHITADLMLYNIEIAQTYSTEKNLADPFYKSIAKSFDDLVKYILLNGMLPEFRDRIMKCHLFATKNHWPYQEDFSKSLDLLD